MHQRSGMRKGTEDRKLTWRAYILPEPRLQTGRRADHALVARAGPHFRLLQGLPASALTLSA